MDIINHLNLIPLQDVVLVISSIISTYLGYLTKRITQFYIFILLFLGLICLAYFELNFPIKYILYISVAYSIGFLLTYIKDAFAEDYSNDIDVVPFETTKGTIYLKGIKAGASVFGASRSGKTASIISRFLEHFIKDHNASAYVYDFKDGELAELVLGLKPDATIFAPHLPSKSVRINILAPKYIESTLDVVQFCSVLGSTLIRESGEKGNFFTQGAEGLLAGIILRFKEDYPDYCTFPHIVAFILAVDFNLSNIDTKGKLENDAFGLLVTFLKSNDKAYMQASTFINGKDAKNQTAGLISSLANGLRKIVDEDIFWVLSKDEYDLRLNKSDGNVFVYVNKSKNYEAMQSIIACITTTIFNQMMTRSEDNKVNKSVIVLDEAFTIKLDSMATITATMASFGVSTIYSCQDVVQGYKVYGKDGFKSIINNLSTQFFGKANDPESAKFYEGYFPMVDKKIKSTTRGEGKSSTTTSIREQHRHRSQEFFELSQGKFGFVTFGKANIYQFKMPKIESKKIPVIREISKKEKVENFNKIIEDMRFFSFKILEEFSKTKDIQKLKALEELEEINEVDSEVKNDQENDIDV